MTGHWREAEDGKARCMLFFVVLQFYCDEPPERHCAQPPDPEHLKVCELAHHAFRATHGICLPPKDLMTRRFGRQKEDPDETRDIDRQLSGRWEK